MFQNYSLNNSKAKILAWFKLCGPVKDLCSIKISGSLLKLTKTEKDFYFVEYMTSESASKAVKGFNGAMMENRAVTPVQAAAHIYKNKEAGTRFAAGLAMGSSRPWSEVTEVMTGQEQMDATAIRDYFAPLEKWLTAKNVELGESIGWKN